MAPPTLKLQEISQHNSQTSCWVIIKDNVYDVTEFLQEHPGGSSIILKYAGKDATLAYEPIHPLDALDKNSPPVQFVGQVESGTAQVLHRERESRKKTKDDIRVEEAHKRKPPLSRILSLADIEKVASQVLSHKAWAYYSSGADEQITHSENTRAFSRFFFHARVMRPVGDCDPSTTILGFRSSIPIFASGAALAKLGHPNGEANITRGAGKEGIIQMVSSNASLSYAEIISVAVPPQVLFFQLYKNKVDAVAEKRVREVERLGYQAIFLTVDAIVAGNREADIRSPWILEDEESGVTPVWDENVLPEGVNINGTAGALVNNDAKDMSFEKTIPWLRGITKLPIVIKGIQCVEDAVSAADAGVDGILLSNHGGRQLDYSMPPMEVLYRLRRQRPDIFDRLEVYIDGGAYRGTDVVKALCLGAKAVGFGRAFLYAQSAYGEAGVAKIIQLLKREIVTVMQLVGARTVSDLKPEMVERVDWEPLTRSKL
ncbi:cytochrome b2 [Coprinopsis marcescibilis]|uniref:L-lactate dehydrogenase (cytochrome) n=1 Tax=Coprinopsis marcescibilis TaxID=230819 RepID=A0A5C3LPB8_COPMA|nr:cytochrome b2 [Coprinopsis marcescibilis]